MSAKRLASQVAANLSELWEQAQPQLGGIYWRKTRLAERIIDFKQPVESILRHIRAYGVTESLAYINDNWFVVKQAVGWSERPQHAPGHLAHGFNRNLVVAAADGYIGLLDCELTPPHVIPELQAALQSNSDSIVYL